MLRLSAFGGCFLERDGMRLDGISAQRRGIALLTLLAAERDGLQRESVSAMFWPDSDDERARTSLRQLVHSLRSQLDEPDLLLPSAELRLNPDRITSDVAALVAAFARGEHATVVSLHHAPFLDGFSLRGADGFERWVEQKRAAFQADAVLSMKQLAATASARGDASDAAVLWRRVAAADPFGSRTAIALMQALDAAGERAAAVQHANVYVSLTRTELGLEPDRAVLELAERLRQPMVNVSPILSPSPSKASEKVVADVSREVVPSEPNADTLGRPASSEQVGGATASAVRTRTWSGWRSVLLALVAVASVAALSLLRARNNAKPLTGVDGRSTVAVLPFVNTSGNSADEHLADGLTDELISALGRSTALSVTGRTSVFALKGGRLSARTIADTLGVGLIVEGSWRRIGDRLRVTAQLLRAPGGAVLWADTYERDAGDVFAAQSAISADITVAVQRRITGDASQEVASRARRAIQPAAYDQYLRGRHVLNSRVSPDGVAQAIRFFAQAIALDPSYAQAHAGLSDAYTRQAVFSYAQPREALNKGKIAALRALELDSALAEAHASLGHAMMLGDFAWAASERELRTAIALDRGYSYARLVLAIWLGSRGRGDEALAQLDTARAADPLSRTLNNVLGRTYVTAGRPAEAIRTLRLLLELDPNVDFAQQQLGHAYLLLGQADSALTEFRASASRHGPRDSAQLAYALAVTGQTREASSIIESIVRNHSASGALSFHVAMAYAGLGDRDAAFDWLRRAVAERVVTGVLVDPGFASLRNDARWAPLLGTIGLRALSAQ